MGSKKANFGSGENMGNRGKAKKDSGRKTQQFLVDDAMGDESNEFHRRGSTKQRNFLLILRITFWILRNGNYSFRIFAREALSVVALITAKNDRIG